MTQAQWLDEEAGPVVRPYALIGGRTRSSGDRLDLIAMVMATGEPRPPDALIGPEQEKILRIAQRAVSVADVAADLDLPLGVVRVLLGDLHDHGLISVRSPAAVVVPLTSDHILKEVINGLRAL